MSTIPAGSTTPSSLDSPQQSSSPSLSARIVEHWSKVAAIVAVLLSLATLLSNAAGGVEGMESRISVVETKVDSLQHGMDEQRQDIKVLLQRSSSK